MPTDPELAAGTTLGDFRVERLIGAGGMGHVYLARQSSLQRRVALKTLRPELTRNPQSLERFLREGRAVAKLTHANIVQVYAIGEEAGIHFMALEYVEGRNLRDYLDRKGPPDFAHAVAILRQVTQALIRAHEAGFVHRDVKPENILISKKGEVKVADFGLSRVTTTDEAPPSLTQSGVTMGTPLYMSPEQVRGHPADQRSDLYSLGVTAYHLLAGEPPFKGATAFDVAMCHVQTEAPSLTVVRPDVPPELLAVVVRLMQKSPEARYQTGRELLRDLSAIRDSLQAGRASLQQLLISAPLALPVSLSGEIPNPTPAYLTSLPRPRFQAWKWLTIGGVLFLAVAVGVRLRLHGGDVAPVEESTAARDLIDDPAVGLKRKLSDPSLRRDAKQDIALQLGLLLCSRRQYDQALDAFDEFAKMPPDPDSEKRFLAQAKATSDLVAGLGHVIVRSAQNQWEASNKAFIEQITPKKLGDRIGRTKSLELMKRGPWRKAVVDALVRNARNAPPDAVIDERIRPYLSYFPPGPSVEGME